MPNFSAAAVAGGSCDGGQDVGLSLQAQQSEEGEDEGFLIIDDIVGRHDNMVFCVCLNPFHEIFVFGTATGN